MVPIHILFSHFTYSYTFWANIILHYYTFEGKKIHIHILGALKSIPHSSCMSVYTFKMEVTPPVRSVSDQIFIVIMLEVRLRDSWTNEYLRQRRWSWDLHHLMDTSVHVVNGLILVKFQFFSKDFTFILFRINERKRKRSNSVLW